MDSLNFCVTMCPPGVRMVAVMAAAHADGSHDVYFLPIVAIRTTSHCEPYRPYRPGPPDPLNVVHRTELLVCREFGLETLSECECSNSVCMPESAPWPAEEDSVRLAETVIDAIEQASEKRNRPYRSTMKGNQ